MNLVATDRGLGAVEDDGGIALLDLPHADCAELLAEDGWRERARRARVIGRVRHAALMPPLRPRSFWLVGSNYPGRGVAPRQPAFYLRAASALSGPGDRVALPAGSAVTADAELAVVIGRAAHRVPEGRAWDAVAGITACDDLTARDRLDGGRGVAVAKSFPGFGALGGSLLIVEERVDVEVTLRIDGARVQKACTDEMLFGVAELIARLSRLTRLEPGDVIATGSPPAPAGGEVLAGQSATVEVDGVLPLVTRLVAEDDG